MSRAPAPLFLERRSYRHRRVTDAALFLPVLAAVLWALPLAWSRPANAEQGMSTSTATLYIFGVWGLLILAAALLARGLKHLDPATPAARDRPTMLRSDDVDAPAGASNGADARD